MREAGCFVKLQKLLDDDHKGDPRVRRAAMAAVGNLALNTANQKEMAVSGNKNRRKRLSESQPSRRSQVNGSRNLGFIF